MRSLEELEVELQKRRIALATRVAARTGHNVDTVAIVLDGLRSLNYKIVAEDLIQQATYTVMLDAEVASDVRYIDHVRTRISRGIADFFLRNGIIDFERSKHDGREYLRGNVFTVMPKKPEGESK